MAEPYEDWAIGNMRRMKDDFDADPSRKHSLVSEGEGIGMPSSGQVLADEGQEFALFFCTDRYVCRLEPWHTEGLAAIH